MGGRKFKLLLLLVVLVGYIEAAPSIEEADVEETTISDEEAKLEVNKSAPSVEEPPNQPPKTITPTTENENDNLKPVNLIFPRVEYIDKVDCGNEAPNQHNCTIEFRTDLVRYRLVNTSFVKQSGELLRLKIMYTNKARRTDVVYIDGEGHTFKSRTKRAQEWLATNAGGLKEPEEMLEYMICDAYAGFSVKDVKYDLCIHDLTIVVRTRDTKQLYLWSPLVDLVDQAGHSSPVTSVYVYATSESTMEKGLYLLWTNAVGRMRFGKLMIKKAEHKGKKDEIAVEPEGHLDLSIIHNPTMKNSFDKMPTALSKKPELEKKFKKDLEMKWRSDFIMAASPIYQSFSIKNRNAENITEEKLDSIGLCFVRGYNMSETQEAPLSTNFECKLNGVNQNSFVELPKLNSAYFLVTHAYHVVNVDGYRYIHIFFTLKHHEQNQNRYVFCKQKGGYSPNKGLSSSTTLSDIVIADTKTNPGPNEQDSYCNVLGDDNANRLHASPSDIIAYYDGKMVKTITFYSLLYMVSNYDKPIGKKDHSQSTLQVIEGITFRINAAFSTGKTVYFFTHNNYIVYADMKMDADYSKLTIDFDSAGEYYAEQFIYNNFLRPKGDTHTLDHPYIDGYYEYEKDADDTFPPTKVKTGGGKGENGTKPGSDPGDRSEPKKSSTIWLIVLIIIIAALILAALAYLFFIRGGDEQVITEPKSAQKSARKSARKSPEPGLAMDSNMKTVRSHQHSSIGAGKSVNLAKSPSQKSAIAKSPIRKSAITKTPSQKSGTKSPSQNSDTKSPSKKSTVKSPLKLIMKSPSQASGTKSSKKSKRKSEAKSPAAKSVRKSQKSPARSPTGIIIHKTTNNKN